VGTENEEEKDDTPKKSAKQSHKIIARTGKTRDEVKSTE